MLSLALCVGGMSCRKYDSSSEEDSKTETAGEIRDDPNSGNKVAVSPCALTISEVGEIVNETVTEALAQGNWGIASTCSYATVTAPAAVNLASARSTDLSSDRMFEGWQEIYRLGDEAVWVPVMSTLAVTDKSKNKLLRIGVHVPGSKEERLAVAKAIARLALPKL